ncbi:hypothetical protein D9M72_576660 [compost metagenome]
MVRHRIAPPPEPRLQFAVAVAALGKHLGERLTKAVSSPIYTSLYANIGKPVAERRSAFERTSVDRRDEVGHLRLWPGSEHRREIRVDWDIDHLVVFAGPVLDHTVADMLRADSVDVGAT